MMKSGWEIIGVNTLSDEEIIDDPILKEMFASNLETSEQFQHEKQSDNSLEDFTNEVTNPTPPNKEEVKSQITQMYHKEVI